MVQIPLLNHRNSHRMKNTHQSRRTAFQLQTLPCLYILEDFQQDWIVVTISALLILLELVTKSVRIFMWFSPLVGTISGLSLQVISRRRRASTYAVFALHSEQRDLRRPEIPQKPGYSVALKWFARAGERRSGILDRNCKRRHYHIRTDITARSDPFWGSIASGMTFSQKLTIRRGRLSIPNNPDLYFAPIDKFE